MLVGDLNVAINFFPVSSSSSQNISDHQFGNYAYEELSVIGNGAYGDVYKGR